MSESLQERRWGVVEVAGRDARKLLQGQLTREVAAASPETAPLAAWCNAKGRVVVVCRVLFADDGRILLPMPAPLVGAVAQRLSLYVLRDDARVAARAEEWGCGVLDRESASRIAQTLGLTLPTGADGCVSDGTCWLTVLPSTDGEAASYELCGPAERLASLSLPEDFARARLQAGLPSVYPETREEFLPQMLNLDLLGGISRSKGCYVGQEIITRTQSLGRIKRRMLLLEGAPEAPPPGTALYADGESAGQVVDACPPLLLAVAPVEKFAARWSLDAEGRRPLSRRALPYAIPEAIPEEREFRGPA